MIVGVCSDKGSPGVSTLTVSLGLVWPGDRVVLDADTAGGDLPYRLWAAGPAATRPRLSPDPSIAALATAARLGLSELGPLPFAQDTSLGVPVVPGALSAERFRPLRGLWPGLAAQLAAWPGTVIADLGRLQPGNPTLAVAEQAAVVLLLTQVDLESLAHLRDRVQELAPAVDTWGGAVSRLAVVPTGPPSSRRFAVDQTRQVVTSTGIPVEVAGFFAQDAAAARGLWAGEVTRRVAGSDLVRSARRIAEEILGWLPAAATTATPPAEPVVEEPAGPEPATAERPEAPPRLQDGAAPWAAAAAAAAMREGSRA